MSVAGSFVIIYICYVCFLTKECYNFIYYPKNLKKTIYEFLRTLMLKFTKYVYWVYIYIYLSQQYLEICCKQVNRSCHTKCLQIWICNYLDNKSEYFDKVDFQVADIHYQ